MIRTLAVLALSVILMVSYERVAAETVQVFAATVKRDRFVDRLEALGTLRANESVSLSPTITENVTAVRFDDGDRVSAGQVLVEMTKREERAQLEEARATVEEARRQYRRVQALAAKGTESRFLLDQRRREWDTAKARLKAIESRLGDHVIKAPFSGVMGLRNVSPGTLLEPGDIIGTLDDDSVMKLDFPVPSSYLQMLKPGLPIEARSAVFGEQAFEGKVKSVDSRIDAVTRSVVVRALIPNPDGSLRPGLLMRVELLRNPREALVIPESALTALREEQYVYVIPAGEQPKPERRKISIGGRRPGEVEVLQGLSEGEMIVTDGAFKIRPGDTVSVQAPDDGHRRLGELLSPKK